MTVIGAGLLWFGWFGFNAGSALEANGLAASAFVGHQHRGRRRRARLDVHRVDAPRQADRARRGVRRRRGPRRHHPGVGFRHADGGDRHRRRGRLRSATAACNFKAKLGYDDSLDVVGVHGVGGTWGALATGLFATKAVNAAGGDGLFYGNPGQLWIQIVAVAATYALAIVGTVVISQGRRRDRRAAGQRRGRGGRARPLPALGDGVFSGAADTARSGRRTWPAAPPGARLEPLPGGA